MTKNECNLLPDNLIKLKELMPKLEKELRVASFASVERRFEWVQVHLPGGETHMGRILMENELICVVEATGMAGLKYPMHQHPGHEIVVVFEGRIKMVMEDKEYIVKNDGKPFYVPYRVAHSFEVIENTKLIAMTIPGDKDWGELGHGRRSKRNI